MQAYQMCGDKIYKKIIGIPEGLEVSPALNDMYLTVWPLTTLLRKLKEGRVREVASLYHTYRMADDILSLNNTSFPAQLLQLWPTNRITLENETSELHPGKQVGNEAIFLDATFTIVDGILQFKPYNKLLAKKIPHTRQEHMHSNLPSQMVTNTLYGAMLRMAYASSNQQAFLNATLEQFQAVSRFCGFTRFHIEAVTRKFESNINKFLLPFALTNGAIESAVVEKMYGGQPSRHYKRAKR